MSLAELNIGDKAVVAYIEHMGAISKRLASLGLSKGASIALLEKVRRAKR